MGLPGRNGARQGLRSHAGHEAIRSRTGTGEQGGRLVSPKHARSRALWSARWL